MVLYNVYIGICYIYIFFIEILCYGLHYIFITTLNHFYLFKVLIHIGKMFQLFQIFQFIMKFLKMIEKTQKHLYNLQSYHFWKIFDNIKRVCRKSTSFQNYNIGNLQFKKVIKYSEIWM